MRSIIVLALILVCSLFLLFRGRDPDLGGPPDRGASDGARVNVALPARSTRADAGVSDPGRVAVSDPLATIRGMDSVGAAITHISVGVLVSSVISGRQFSSVELSDSAGLVKVRFNPGVESLDCVVIADGYCATRLPRVLPGQAYDVVLENAVSQDFLVTEPGGAPIAGVKIALSEKSMCEPLLSAIAAAGTDERGRVEGSDISGWSAGGEAFLAVTDRNGLARFKGLRQATYWTSFNVGGLPLVRSDATNPFVVSCPSAICSVVLTRLSAAIVRPVDDEVVASYGNVLEFFARGLDATDASLVRQVKRELSEQFSGCLVFVGAPLEGVSELKIDVCWRHGGWVSAVAPLSPVGPNIACTVIRPSSVEGDNSALISVDVVDGKGVPIPACDGMQLFLRQAGHPPIPVIVGREARLISGKYDVAPGLGMPSDIFQSGQVVVVGGASRAAVAMNGNWRKCVVEVMANGEPVAEFGVAKLISRGVSTSGHSGSRWEVWIDKDPQQVEFFVKGFASKIVVLEWINGIGDAWVRSFKVDVG